MIYVLTSWEETTIFETVPNLLELDTQGVEPKIVCFRKLILHFVKIIINYKSFYG